MPVGVARQGKYWRVVEHSGRVARNAAGTPVDGRGHKTREGALRQARAINANLHKATTPHTKRTLYVSRPLLNSDELTAWAKSQSFTSTLKPTDFHTTIAFSKAKLDWSALTPVHWPLRIKTQTRSVHPLGDKDAIVLRFTSNVLRERWNDFLAIGATWEFDGYRPHVTITYRGSGLSHTTIKPFTGDLLFGPERWKEINENWDSEIEEVEL